MAFKPFIDFYETLEQALFVRTSPYDKQNKFRFVQLLPNNVFPYVQVTANANGVEVEDWTVTAVNMFDNSETDFTSYFNVDEIIFDDNGQNQIAWSLLNIPHDFKQDFIYLVIDQFGQKYYSNPFLLTNSDNEKTVRFDYRDDEDSPMQSTQLRMFYRENLIEQELESYTKISSGITVTATTQTRAFLKYVIEFAPKYMVLNLVKMFSYNIFVYLDLKRVNLYRPIEIPGKVGQANFTQNYVYISEIGGLDYDPLYVPPQLPVNYSPTHYNSDHYSTT